MKDRTLLMIPGPIEFEPAVLAALGAPTTSHVAPDFIEAFGQALERMRDVFLCPDGQPFVVAGSGTLAMELAGANLVEPGDKALVVNTGYFGDRFGDLLARYGADVTHVRAPVGGCPSLDAVDEALEQDSFKLLTVTQVDTSTGVLADVEGLACRPVWPCWSPGRERWKPLRRARRPSAATMPTGRTGCPSCAPTKPASQATLAPRPST
jgi:alanine-glyoxylate transaminase/serine-glyoxylate transaminase/serine-pyruvate transaminase